MPGVQSMHKAMVVDGLLDYLKSLHEDRKFAAVHSLLYKLFDAHTSDIGFMTFAAKRLGVNHVQCFFNCA